MMKLTVTQEQSVFLLIWFYLPLCFTCMNGIHSRISLITCKYSPNLPNSAYHLLAANEEMVKFRVGGGTSPNTDTNVEDSELRFLL